MKNYLSNDFDLTEFIDVFDEISVWAAPFGLKLLDYVEYKPNITALDIGFGNGFPLTELAMRLGNSSAVYGIDPWKETFNRVNKKIEYYRINNIKLIEGVAESIPLNNNSLDLIVSNNGINNVQDINLVFSECSRLLKQGGQFVFTMNTDKSMYEFYDQLEFVLSELNMFNEIDNMHHHIYQKRRPINEITAMLHKAGFIIKNLEYDQFNYKFTNGTAMLNHYFIRLAFMDSWIKLLPSESLEQIFDKIELRLNEQSLVFGGIKLSIPYVMINTLKK